MRLGTFSAAFSQKVIAQCSSGWILSSPCLVHKAERRQSFALQAGARSASSWGSVGGRGGIEQTGGKKNIPPFQSSCHAFILF